MFNWSLLQSFAAVAEYGSLSAAARSIQLSQPTLSRHISELENLLGYRLFNRCSSGLNLTLEGKRLVDHAMTMNDAAHSLRLQAESKSESLSGTVRITASQMMASYILPSSIAKLKCIEPNIVIELVASDQTDNLLRREADIAIRMYRPTQNDVITKKIGELSLGMFASLSYIESYGNQVSNQNMHQHKFIGYDRSTLIIDGFKQAGINVDRNFFAFRSDDQVVCWKMVMAGLGIGFNQRHLANDEPEVAEVYSEMNIEPLPIWLTAHNELQSSSRVRFVYDFLATSLSEQAFD